MVNDERAKTYAQIEAHIRALSALILGSVSAETEIYLQANEYGLALFNLSAEVSELVGGG